MAEKAEDRVPWLLIIPLLVLVAIVIPFVFFFTQGNRNLAQGFIAASWNVDSAYYEWSPLAFFVLTIASYALSASPSMSKYLDIRKVTYIFAALLLAMGTTGAYPAWTFGVLYRGRYLRPLDEGKFIPEWWIPNQKTLTDIFTPGNPVDWGIWGPCWGAFALFAISNALIFLGLNSIFRRQWIDTERVPYPVAQVYVNMVQLVQEKGKSDAKYSRKLIFGVGWIVGFGFFLMILLKGLLAWFPDPLKWYGGWRVGMEFTGVVTLNHAQTFPSLLFVVPKMRLTINPLFIAMAYFASPDVLLSIGLFWLVFEGIIGQTLWSVGVHKSSPWAWFDEPPMRYNQVSQGMIWGLIIWWVVLNYKYLTSTIRLAVGKGSDWEKKLEEADVQYKWSYLVLVIGLITFVAMNAMWGMWPLLNFVFTLGWMVALMGWARARSIALFGAIGWQAISGTGWTRIAIGDTITYGTMSAGQFMSSMWADVHGNLHTGTYLTAFTAGDSYKVGSAFNVSNVNLFKVMLLSCIIVPIISYPVFIATAGQFGLTKLQVTLQGASYFGRPEKFNNSMGAPPYEPYSIIGILISGGLILARMRFPWFPIDPAGAAVGLTPLAWEMGIGGICLQAWVFKYLTLKIGGVRAYERYGIPFAVGIIAGFVVDVVIMVLGTFVRYWFPW